MTDWHADKLVVVNDAYDREYASGGHSRYGAYLRQNASLFKSAWSDQPEPIEDPAEFAVHAWQIATAPPTSGAARSDSRTRGRTGRPSPTTPATNTGHWRNPAPTRNHPCWP